MKGSDEVYGKLPYLLPQRELYERLGCGFAFGSIFGFIAVPETPIATRLRHRFPHMGRKGCKFAFYFSYMGSAERALEPFRDKYDPFNAFVAGALLSGFTGFRGGPVIASARSLLLGSLCALLKYAFTSLERSARAGRIEH